MLLDASGKLKIVPSAVLASTTVAERVKFGHLHAVYNFPTTELIDYLKTAIAGRSAIEIGAGNGVMAKALGIPATDSRQQERPEIQALYALQGQPVIKYGEHVECLDAHEAVRKYKPQVVVATWVTHRYDPAQHELGGNMDGVDEDKIIDNCEEYIFIGNMNVHRKKKIWSRGPAMEYPHFLYSRTSSENPNFIARFKGGLAEQ